MFLLRRDSSRTQLDSVITRVSANSLPLVILLSMLFNRFVISEDRLTPRGVPLSRAALYDPLRDFSCLDGSKFIPFSFVNDDYCDCSDGSDEPGTSACETGVFFCLNAGHSPLKLRTSRVNDQLCDCCDGTDEFDGMISCPNTCDELGRAAREENERQVQLAREGYQKRIEMSQSGKESRRLKQEEISHLEVERQQADTLKDEKRLLKEEVEAPEKEALERHRLFEEEKRRKEDEEEKLKTTDDSESMFQLLDSNEDGVITVDEIKTRQTFDRNKDGIVSDEEAMFFLNMETEMSKEEFLKNGWIIVKPYFLMESGMFLPPEPEAAEGGQQPTEQVDATTVEPPPLDADADLQTPGDYEDDEVEDNKEPDLAGRDNLDEEHEEEEDDQKEDVDKIRHDLYDETTRGLIEAADKARKEFQDAEKAARDITNKLQELNDALNLDVGDDDRFAPLLGQCFEYSDREYTYSLCPYNAANQRGQGGGGEVHLGKWGSWAGPENDKYSAMLYDRGQSCWNGPTRSVKVQIQCGTENRILSVSEPSRCEYQMDFSTPAACRKLDSSSHDEL